MNRYGLGMLLLASLPCLASEPIPFPPLEEGRWALSTSGVLKGGEKFSTPESVVPCVLPARLMQRDLDRLDEKGCKVHTLDASPTTVKLTVNCAVADGDKQMRIALTATDRHRFHQVLTTGMGTNELKGRWLGACNGDADKQVTGMGKDSGTR